MYKHIKIKNMLSLPSRLLMVLCFFLVVCILFTSTSLASDDIDPATYDWINDPNDGYNAWALIDSNNNARWIVTLGIHASSTLINSHCKTNYGTRLEHEHWSGELSGEYVTDANRYWDWFYGPIGGSSIRISSTSNKTNCLCYAMDGYAGNANYDYWVSPGYGTNQGNAMFIDDCSMRTPPIYADVEEDDRLAYGYLWPPDYTELGIAHATIINSVSGDEPTEIEWKTGHSGVYRWDNSSADDQYSTPGCDVTTFNWDQPPEGEYDPDFFYGGLAIAFYH